MKFRVGDKVLVTAPDWCEECVVSKMGISSTVMFVRRAGGRSPAVYKSWASKIASKNQQLLFEFMD
jgi:hypothetical protein